MALTPLETRRLNTMHPLVRDLYKRVLIVGQDYPTGLDHVKRLWKTAIRNPNNCPSWYDPANPSNDEEELLRAVHKGRHMVKEMIGVIQIKKYRAMDKRYGRYSDSTKQQQQRRMQLLEQQATTIISTPADTVLEDNVTSSIASSEATKQPYG